MSMSFGLGANLSTSQKLTPQMQQAIKLLAMSSLELEQEVQQKLDSNPLLERIDDGFDEFDDLPTDSDNLDQWTADNWSKPTSLDTDGFGEDADYADGDGDAFDKLDQQYLDDNAYDSDWQNVYDEKSYQTQEFDDEPTNGQSTDLSIQDHIRWQINFKPLTDTQKLIADHLIDAMDDLGFIRLPIADLVKNFTTVLQFYQADITIDENEVLAVLAHIQSCNPTGVGARNLAECLLLQLNELDCDTAFVAEAKILLSHSELLQTGNLKALKQACDLSESDIKSAMALIRTLDPAPATTFVGQHNQSVGKGDGIDIPDIFVFAKNKGKTAKKGDEVSDWQVILNPETLPRLRVNEEYANLIKRGDESADNLYLKNSLTDARLFIRSIEERNQNLLKVATCIVQKQQKFLLHGASAMQPLTLKDVAEVVGVHESTVSRLTSNKSMLTPQGLFPLKYFFSSYVSGVDGEVSSTAICAMISEMIASEDPTKPLSDDKITSQLEATGISISRRTVTKYREAMHIGSSTERRRQYGGGL